MKIGVDVDGVLADFYAEYRREAAKLTGRDFKGIDPVDWGWSNFNLTPDEHKTIWKTIAETEEFWTFLAKLPNTDLLLQLTEKHDVYFITNRAPAAGRSLTQQTAEWLQERFYIAYPQVLVTKHKGAVCKALGIELFIDDNVDNCKEVEAQEIKVYLNTLPHNLENKDLKRVNNFNHFAALCYLEK
jgi:5'(3')-deoxyribonucleotidase